MRSLKSPWLQWSRRLSTSETVGTVSGYFKDYDASMEPTSFNVGDSPRGFRGPLTQLSFNGADVFQRRRQRTSSRPGGVGLGASMEPTSFNVGDWRGIS